MTVSQLRARIDSREAVIGVIGLGYVGLPLACVFADAGFRVVGIDIHTERVALINAGNSPIEGREPDLAELLMRVTRGGRLRASRDYESLREADVTLIAVETPVGEDHSPHFHALTAACSALAGVMKDNTLVIIESTVAPLTIDRLVGPLLEQVSGLRLNEGFYLGHCPERVMPGRLLANLRHLSRVCGGSSPETAAMIVALYRAITTGELDPTDCLTAELVKTTENTYRDVNIAFANEVALICESVGGDVWRVRDLVNKSPGRNMLMPGGGVGGHCLPKDPWLLVANARGGFATQLIAAARRVNDGMPNHVVELVRDVLAQSDRTLDGSRVTLLGYSYLPNVADLRNSPSIEVVAQLRRHGADVVIHDPYVGGSTASVDSAVRGSDCIVLMVAHDEYAAVDWSALSHVVRTPAFVDTRNIVGPSAVISAGFLYRSVGRAGSGASAD